jgi:hypothetical protein
MRIWDLDPTLLCRQHLLAEHRELHAVWSVIVNRKKGCAKHPETMRWRGRLRALYRRHELLAREMGRRGYLHQSPLDKSLARGAGVQEVFVNTVEEQLEILKRKACDCAISPPPRP